VLRRICVLLLSVLALLMLALPPATASALDRTIAVQGEATRKVPNDAAGLGFSVTKTRGSKGAALHVVAIRLRAVIAAVKAIPGVGAGDVTTGSISVRRRLTRDGKTRWRASEGIGVVLHQPTRAGEMVAAAIRAGATGTRGPRFFLSDRESAFNGALLAAFDQAKAKATALAAQAGGVLGPTISIEEPREEVVEAVPVSAAVGAPRARPAPPTKPGTSTVNATVRVVFALE